LDGREECARVGGLGRVMHHRKADRRSLSIASSPALEITSLPGDFRMRAACYHLLDLTSRVLVVAAVL
jgi:hypothetical protein